MKKDKIFEEIGKDKKILGYVFKILLLLMFSSVFAFSAVLDFLKDFSDWENVFMGICIIIYSTWCLIESFSGIIKIGNMINKKEKEQEK